MDENKNERNKRIHGVSFEEAREVFSDPYYLSIFDDRNNYGEDREIAVGMTSKEVLLVVVHVYRDIDGVEFIRIISARKAAPIERKWYESK